MSIGKEYEQLIVARERLEGDIDYDKNPVIIEMVELLSKDMESTVSFLNDECSESQFVWMSEIFDEVAERTKSKDFISALRKTAKKYPRATAEYNIDYFIESAEEYVE